MQDKILRVHSTQIQTAKLISNKHRIMINDYITIVLIILVINYRHCGLGTLDIYCIDIFLMVIILSLFFSCLSSICVWGNNGSICCCIETNVFCLFFILMDDFASSSFQIPSIFM